MATREITATVVRDESKVATHYIMKEGDRTVGTTARGEKGDFTFTPADGIETGPITEKTMKALKESLLKKVAPESNEAKAARMAQAEKEGVTLSKPSKAKKTQEAPVMPEPEDAGADLDLD